MRAQRISREKQSRPFINERTPQRKSNLVSITNASPSMPLSKEAKELEVGNIIEHERFGRGKVSAIELSGNDKRAIVEFESAGTKQLLLKFAKFKIVE